MTSLSQLRKIIIILKIYVKALCVFMLTMGLLSGLMYGCYSGYWYIVKKRALRMIPVAHVRPLKYVSAPNPDYSPTIQTWSVPPIDKLLSPLSWLIYAENCFFSSRMDIMKFVGMIPGHWTIQDFKKAVNNPYLLASWSLNTNSPLTNQTINEINKAINKNSKAKYRWYSLESMDELVHALRNGQHVMIYNQVWIKPTKKNPRLRLYIGNYAHVSTLTGIKSYDPQKKIIEFEVYDPLPFFGVRYPVYNKLTVDGWNMFGRQSIPFIVSSGDRVRSGYIIKEN